MAAGGAAVVAASVAGAADSPPRLRVQPPGLVLPQLGQRQLLALHRPLGPQRVLVLLGVRPVLGRQPVMSPGEPDPRLAR